MTTATPARLAHDDLVRVAPFHTEPERARGATGDGLTLSGHAAVFDAVTVIDSWEGTFREQIARGAFTATFAEQVPVLQFDHGHHPVVGSLPIGTVTRAEEDQVGALVEARLHENWMVQPVRDAIASGAVTGMSFRFSVVREEWADEDGTLVADPRKVLDLLSTGRLTRTLLEVKVPELGPVVWPAYATTDVSVRERTHTTSSRAGTDPGGHGIDHRLRLHAARQRPPAGR